jgi:hypothetical protein
LVDFNVERHTLVTRKIIQVFHHSSTIVTQCSKARVHSSRVRAQLMRGFLVDLSHPGRIPRFPSDPFERRARCIFFMVPHQILIEESTGSHFFSLGRATLLVGTIGVPERASDQIQRNPFDPFPNRPR